jgi:sugar phosphate isomerase/epimerase
MEESLQLKASQCDAIGLWRPKVADVGTELAADLIQDAGLGVSSLSFVGGFTGVNGLSFDEAMTDARDAICDAERLGAENVIVVGGARNGHTHRHSRRLVIQALTQLADFAGERGTNLSVLPMHRFFSRTWTFLNTLDETLEILDAVSSPSVMLAFDTYHLWQEPRLLERIPHVAAMTGIVQVSDALRPPQSSAERCLPGEGVIPLAEIVGAFQQSGYDGYYDVQVWSAAGWSAEEPNVVSQCRESLLRIIGQSAVLM